MKRILHVVNIYFVLPYFIGDQFKYFAEKGYKLFVACSPSEYLPEYTQKQGFEYIETPILRSFNIKQDFLSIRRICKYIKKNKIDIVVGHTPKGGLLAMIAAWVMRVPNRIYFRHGLVYETSHWAKRQILMLVDRLTSLLATKIVCVGSYVLEKSIKDHLAPAKKQLILGSGSCGGIDTVYKFNPERLSVKDISSLRENLKIKEGDFVIGYTGRLVRDKGIIELVNAFLKVRERCQNAKLLLVGMFEERDALPQNIQDLIIQNPDIIYTGFVNKDIELYYCLMSVYVLASYREGFSIGPLEAQAMRVPVLTTNDTGCRDTIKEGETGLYVNRTSEDIEDKVNIIINGYAFGDCRQWVVEHFDNRVLWPEIEKLY